MAELTLSAGDIAAALKKNLEGFEPSFEARTVGRVTEVGDGIARVSGLPDCGVNELLEFVGSSRVDLQACKLEYSIVSPK